MTLAGTETSAFTQRLGIGITVPDIEAGTLASALGRTRHNPAAGVGFGRAGAGPGQFLLSRRRLPPIG
ncbi:hypothetical protein N8D56_15295 [Devosia sp. A8/3-2]|nr:hypothetical protein N8D56_15295 [Devosia sp. A8/3-2]